MYGTNTLSEKTQSNEYFNIKIKKVYPVTSVCFPDRSAHKSVL